MTILWFLCLFSLTVALEMHEGVIFEKVNEITTTKSQWKMALIMDISLFQNVLAKLEQDIAVAEEISVQILNSYNNSELDSPGQRISNKHQSNSDIETLTFVDSLNNLKQEIKFLKTSYQQILESYIGYKVLHTRTTRSLLPLSGFFKFVFGTAKDEDVSALKHSVRKLASTQRSILHVVESNLSILNVSRNDISQNRQAINSIITTLGQVDDKIKKFTGKIEKQVDNLQQYTLQFNNLQLVITQVRDLLRHAQFYLGHFERQLNMLSLSKLSPSMITPLNLKALLSDIMTQVPLSNVLPIDIETNLWDFYKILKCDTFLYDNQIAIIVHIPLLDLNGKLNVYKVHTLNIPYYNPRKINQNTDISMTAKYDKDTAGLLINIQRNLFGVLNSEELIQCSDPVRRFCHVESPMYHVALSQRCSIALFTKNEEKIKKFCQTIVMPNTKLPAAEYLFKGQWVITTNIKLRFVIVCYSNDEKKKMS